MRTVYVQDFSEDRCYRTPLISFESKVCSVVSVKKEICFSRSSKTVLEGFRSVVKDCEVVSLYSCVKFPVPVPQLMRGCRQAWRVPRELCWLLQPSISSFVAAERSKSLEHHGLFISLDVPTHLWCSDLTKATGSYRAGGVMLWRCALEAWYLF